MTKFDPTDEEMLRRGANFDYDMSDADEADKILLEVVKVINPMFYEMIDRLNGMPRGDGSFMDDDSARYVIAWVVGGLMGFNIQGDARRKAMPLLNSFSKSLAASADLDINVITR